MKSSKILYSWKNMLFYIGNLFIYLFIYCGLTKNIVNGSLSAELSAIIFCITTLFWCRLNVNKHLIWGTHTRRKMTSDCNTHCTFLHQPHPDNAWWNHKRKILGCILLNHIGRNSFCMVMRLSPPLRRQWLGTRLSFGLLWKNRYHW